jgi:hypothetical protein
MGTVARTAELEFTEEDERHPGVTSFLVDAHAGQWFGHEWFQTVCATASTITNAAISGPSENEEVAEAQVQLLGRPVGLGAQGRQRFAHHAIESILSDADTGAERDVGGLTPNALTRCWLFGYYLGACAASLPDEARSELAD